MRRIGKIWNVRRSEEKDILKPNRRRERPSNPKSDRTETGDSLPSDQRKKAPKILMAALRIVASVVMTVASLWTGYAAYKHAVTSEYFAVREFQVRGLKRLGEKEILQAAGLDQGINVFRVDTSITAAKLMDHPWVLHAEVDRRLPRTVEVNVTERVVAATALFDVPYLVDDQGEVFKRWSPGDPTPAPVLTGLSRERFIRDSSGVTEIIRDALSLAERYHTTGLSKKAPLEEVHYGLDGSFSFAIGVDPIYVRFGKGPYRRKLRRLATLLSELRREGKRPAMIYFDNEVRPDRATVRLKEDTNSLPANASEVSSTRENKSENLQKKMSKI